MNKDTLEKFDNYPVYGTNVIGFLNLLASIAARENVNAKSDTKKQEANNGTGK